MKIRLLKRLRKRFQIQQRNGRYRVFDRNEFLALSSFESYEKSLERRRKWILHEAQKFLKPKNNLTDFK